MQEITDILADIAKDDRRAGDVIARVATATEASAGGG